MLWVTIRVVGSVSFSQKGTGTKGKCRYARNYTDASKWIEIWSKCQNRG